MRTLLVAALFLIALVPAASAAPVPDDLPDTAPADIYLPEYQSCLWKGSYKPLVSTPVLTVWHYTCDDPDW